MKQLITFFVFVLFSNFLVAQNAALRAGCSNPKFDQEVASTISFSVPVMSCTDLNEKLDDMVLLDAREKKEYKVSHIPNATRIGYKSPDYSVVKNLPKDTPIVVYCSIGYRSEKIGEQLQEQGFTRVYNLYGSIFEWVNLGFPVEDETGTSTNQVHTYNRIWSKWVNKEMAEPIW